MKLNKKKVAVISAAVTFICTLALVFGAMAFLRSDAYTLLTLTGKQEYTAEAVRRAARVIDNVYIEDVDEETLYKGALKGMIEVLGDEYSWFVDEESYKKLLEDLNASFSGIGVQVSIDPEDKLITVISPIEDSPAFNAGIKAGDKIIAVNGNAVSYDNYSEAISMLRGSEDSIGEELVITVIRAETGENEDILLKREKIKIKTVKSKMLPSNIGYIRITSFDEPTAGEFKEHFEKLKNEAELNGLVIDLRNNPGGVMEAITAIGDELLPEGLFSYFVYKDGTKQEFKLDSQYDSVPLAVLINGSSASASEAFAGAVRDRKRGVLVGEKSFGKGIVQSIVPFMKTENGQSALYLTSAKYYTPGGECIHKVGIQPDIKVEMPEELKYADFTELTFEEDVQLKTAWEQLQ